MLDFLSEIISFLIGGVLGSVLTLQLKKQKADGKGTVVDQSEGRAGGDMVGRDKSGG